MPAENGRVAFLASDEGLLRRNDRLLGAKNGLRGMVNFINRIQGDNTLEILMPSRAAKIS